MEKLRKYRRILRICPKGIKPPKKRCLSSKETKELLEGEVFIEEKLDGGIVGLSWDHYNYRCMAVGKSGIIKSDDNSKRFYGLNKWIFDNYNKMTKIPMGWIIYGEWMRASHQIFYDELPDFFIAFDIWDGIRYIDYENKEKLLQQLGFEMIPAIFKGRLIEKDIIELVKKSGFSSVEDMEGVVVKNYRKGLMGKYLRREFDDLRDDRWLEKPIVENKLKIGNLEIVNNVEKIQKI